METISVSRFKATCIAVPQRVKRTRKPVLITRFGQPVAELVPPTPRASKADWLGSMAGRAQVLGDVLAPVLEDDAWKALRG
jgi:antitoxin (DNA-binding transcriptional repressor) of toxin-antitoxin stability system